MFTFPIKNLLFDIHPVFSDLPPDQYYDFPNLLGRLLQINFDVVSITLLVYSSNPVLSIYILEFNTS